MLKKKFLQEIFLEIINYSILTSIKLYLKAQDQWYLNTRSEISYIIRCQIFNGVPYAKAK
jgi:hypothetical protein